MVKKNRFLPGSSIDINSDFYKIFEEAGTIKKYSKDEIIYFQEDVAENFYLIKSGRVRMFLISPEGTELTIEILRKGKLFGESSCFSYGSRLTSVSAATDVELISVSLENLYPYLTKYPELMVQMFHLMSLTMKIYRFKLVIWPFTSRKKLAQLLVRLGAHFKKIKMINIILLIILTKKLLNLLVAVELQLLRY
ncbi:cyclic nucleotide-binding domain-containing protein [Clostridium botulinum]|nr:cyclic nucleotide-binding domain-containing protein [Clostridium botulinum]